MHHPKENPWKIKSEKLIYENKWISLTEFQVINPSGNPGIYGKVKFGNVAVGVVPLDEDMNTYLVGQYRFTIDQYSWEIPEGGAPFNLTPLEGAKRELLEETGLTAKYWTEIQQMHLSNSVTDEHSIVYLARGLEQLAPEPEETEQLIVHKIPFSQVYRMVCNGEITDAVTVAAVLRVQLLILENKLP